MVQIAIIGMGLIGTSLGMALRSADEKTSPLGEIKVVGYDQNKRAVNDARGRLAIDTVAGSLSEAVREAQIVVLATPVLAIKELLPQLATLLSPDSVVTDVASTKGDINRWASEMLPHTIDFVGGHPMAGKEQAGSGAATPDLFKDAIYCLTPSPQSRQHALDAIESMVVTIGAKPYYIDPIEHDSYVAGISHLPFLLSIALAEVTGRSRAWTEMSPLAASGYRDVSRLASGDVAMHRDICLTNREAIIHWLNEVAGQLLEMRDLIAQDKAQALEGIFTHAKESRDAWMNARPNMRPGEEDFNGPQDMQRPSLLGRFGKKR